MNSFIQKSLAKEPITTLKNHLVILSSSRVLAFLFRLSTLPLPPASSSYRKRWVFSSQQIFVTTCILLLPYFIIHGKPLLAHCRYASRCQTPHSPSCMRLLSSLIPSRFVTVILTHKYISWSVISFASWNKKTLVKEMTSLIKTSACFYFPGAILKSLGQSVAMEKSRDCRVKLCYGDNLPSYESKPWRNNSLKNGLEFKSQALCGIWSFRSGVVEDSGLIASDGVSFG